MNYQPAIALPVAAAITALALAEGGSSPVSLGVATAAVWLLLGGLLLGGRLGVERLRGAQAALVLFAGALAAWTALSLGWAGDDGAAFVDLVRALLYLGALLLVALAARRGSGPSWLVGIALGGAVVALVAIGARVGGFEADRSLAVELPAAAQRLSFPLGYWNALGYLMAMTLPALAWIAAADRTRLGAVAIAASVPVVLALFLTSSRGALLAGALALAVLAWSSPARPRLLLAGVIAAPAWTVVIALAATVRSELDPFGGVGIAGLALGLTGLLATAAAYLAARRLLADRVAPRIGIRGRPGLLLGLVVVAALAVGAIAGPSSFIGDFRTERGDRAVGTATEALVSGSGRSSFWDAALGAFAEQPLRGIGAGGFENYWNANGELSIPIRNAHSAPLETLAELGLVGGLALLGLLGTAIVALVLALRGPTGPERGVLGALAGVLLAGLVAISLDWTWQLAAATAPLLIALAVISGEGRAAAPRGAEAARSLPVPAIGTAIAAIGIAAVWAGGVLALSQVQLNRGEARLADGELAAAAEATRAADRLQPWSAEPDLTLAAIEQAGANLEAARRRAEEAARRAPDDYRPWLLLAEIHKGLGNVDAARAYTQRAGLLGEAVLGQFR